MTMVIKRRFLLMNMFTISFLITANDIYPEDCTTIENSSLRLACYDNLYKNKQKSEKVLPTQEKQESKKLIKQEENPISQEIFKFKDNTKENNAKEINAIVNSLTTLRDKRITIRLNNGQSWRTLRPAPKGWFKSGLKIKIIENKEDNYILRANGRKGFVRVKEIK